MQVVKYMFQPHGDERGQLVAFEEFKDIPFRIKRVYYMYDTAEGVVRGKHAHKSLEQILVCIHGSCKILLDNGHEKKVVPLEKPYEGLYVANDMWREMYDFSPGAVLLVFASELYDESDYIRNYDEFLNFIKDRDSQSPSAPPPLCELEIKLNFWVRFTKHTFLIFGNEFGKIIAFEEFKDIPFRIKRVYCIYDTAEGVVRGKHAHKTLNQVLVCVSGSCKILLDDGHTKKIVTLEKPYEGLYVSSDMWHEMYDFSSDAVLLVIAPELYDEKEYVRDYDEFLKMVKSKDSQ